MSLRTKVRILILAISTVVLSGLSCPQAFPQPEHDAVHAGALPGEENPTESQTDSTGGLTVPPPILKLPFPSGERWRVTQAYDTGSHKNLDIYALDFTLDDCDAYGRSIVAAAPGRVTWAVVQNVAGQCGPGGYGTNVVIDHGGGYSSRYSHLSALSVIVGDQVAQGEEIGMCGNTGCAVGTACASNPGTHLHFAMQQKQNSIVVGYKPEPMSGMTGFNKDNWYISDNSRPSPNPSPTPPPEQYSLQLLRNPLNGGTINANPAPINGTYAAGTVVTLTANHANGYQFGSWNGVESFSGNSSIVVMNANRTVTANFAQSIVPGDWSPVGGGLNGDVWCLNVDSSGALIAGGDFTTPSRIARFSGGVWSGFGSGTSGVVFALSPYFVNNSFDPGWNVVAGTYNVDYPTTCQDGTPTTIGRWNGTCWKPLSNGCSGGGVNSGGGCSDEPRQVFALLPFGNKLIIGGEFDHVGTAVSSAKNVVQWDGGVNIDPAASCPACWSALGNGFDGRVKALCVWNGQLYAGGEFVMRGDDQNSPTLNHIARWDPSHGGDWKPLIDAGSNIGVNRKVNAMIAYGGNLVVAGDFDHAGGLAASRVAQWNGTSWQTLDSGLDGIIPGNSFAPRAFAIYQGNLIAAIGNPGGFVVQWNGGSWVVMGSGFSGGWPIALTVTGGNLYAGGSFTQTTGGQLLNRVAKWVAAL